MKRLLILSFSLLFSSLATYGQGTAGEDAKQEYRYLVDMPSSGVLEKGSVGVSNDILPDGIVVGRMEVGVFQDVSFGISYGGANIIGSGSPKWYKYPGVNLRFRVSGESLTYPSVTIGFDSQGKGEFFDSTNRYGIKSPGFFVSGSKNFQFLGYLSVNSAVNYSLESRDGDNFLNLMVGAEKTIGKRISAVLEYDFAFNDNAARFYGKGNGYLNLGIRWSVGEGLTLGFDLRDLLSNKKWTAGSADRAIRIEYIRPI
ncbi:MAG: hypothetical protein COZ80_08190 [Ignavibacteria bacterium CG_4_8_14_3_um_filter_37_9]|nr:hypothetical protein [Ignavibacteria bacterium]OIO14877.1 MAG: hypothetical protein AUJ54_13695 [Ignavibacteria bacterium CG1_02_37_35]PIP79492.1 MAG: hypothetical protein COW85_00940 [Ignavibacteria bacterium CG22_combo_CG10-13_8_21_14_all_37_15]PIW98903.1 MAG: hypothetical protein COZ80_08190 [Ignavibacteria bacterium CG_4_8_14_3_um_filter_37_9]PIX95508.1 MAG: hypothetical protein COZ25_00055 [Ignavibacteria bacterium CG_4_10_14_3_um_filter_37_18]PJC57932.1 MAG: hypothetical protein CO025